MNISILGKEIKVDRRLPYEDAMTGATWFVFAVCSDNTYILKTRNQDITMHGVKREGFTLK